MKKGLTHTEKNIESKTAKRLSPLIKFNLTEGMLACFKSNQSSDSIPYELQPSCRDGKTIVLPKIQSPFHQVVTSMTEPLKSRSRTISCRNNFNEKVVFMHYDDIDVYIDNSSKKKTSSSKSKSSESKKRREQVSEADELVSSCMRVITQETDITSQTFSHSAQMSYRHFSPPRQYQYAQLEENPDNSNYYYYPRNKASTRNRRTVTIQESRALTISYEQIEFDGRTTVMVKNIPNKYTQDMLLQEFSVRSPGIMEKFDFFYLPIDKNNQCNIGYAFVNFISPVYIKQFYPEFHMKKWKKYKSPKTCELSYAVCQGTLELANHFKHTKTLQQKDKRLRPLIGANLAGRIKEIKQIKSIVESQRIKE